MTKEEREIYDRLRRLVEQDSAVAIMVRTEDLKVMLDSYNWADLEARAQAINAQRYEFLKSRAGELDLDGGYTQYYVFPRLDRDNGEKKLPIDRRYFTDIDACVDYHRKKS